MGSWGGGGEGAFDIIVEVAYIAKGEAGPCERFHFVSDHVSLLLWMSNMRERELADTNHNMINPFQSMKSWLKGCNNIPII